MATGTSLSAAYEELRATDEKANIQRLTRLLMRGGLALLREVFDSIHPPPNLPAVLSNPAIKAQLQTLRRNRVLTHPEWNCLYNPSGPGTYGKSTDFDISLLCKLLREICSLTPPATGWDILPNSTDHSLEADLARIKFYRNKIYGHKHSMEMTHADFEKLWMEISEALLRIASSISSAKRDEWKKSIESFFHEPLTPDTQENVLQLRVWYRKEMETKDKVEELTEVVKQMKINQDQMPMYIRVLAEKVVEGSVSSVRNNEKRLDFWSVVCSFRDSFYKLFEYLKTKVGVGVHEYRLGRLMVTVSCSSLEVLEELWKEYQTGHLNEMVQATLVSAEVLEKLELSEVKLRTIILEEDYLSYKEFLKNRSGKGEEKAIPEVQESPDTELVLGDLLASIKDNSPWTNKNVLCSIVTSEGGVMYGEGVRLRFPAGAVESPFSFSITLENPSKYYGLLVQKDLEKDVMFGAPTINLRPDGFIFRKPVTLITKFEIQGWKFSDVLILHGKEACLGKITWEDITHSAKTDEASQEVIIELNHFSRIVVLLRKTRIRAKDFVSRLNFRAFHYRLLVLRRGGSLSEKVRNEVEDELALLFVSEDVYHEPFYKLQTNSALVQLEKDQFVKLHVTRSETLERRRISNNENLKVDIHVGEDYELVDGPQESTQFSVQASIWWNAGKVVRLSVKSKKDVRRLCGAITVRGEYGHSSSWDFSEGDLCGYVRSLLGVEEAIFNLIPIARSFGMPEEVMNQLTECLDDESKQLDMILQYWSRKKNVAENLDALRRDLEKLVQDHTSYKVTARGQMHIRNLREFTTKNPDARLFRALCMSVLRDLCIEMECSTEGVERAASSTNHADYFLINNSPEIRLPNENPRPIPEDIASKFRQVCSPSHEPCLKTLMSIIPYLIQNVKEIYVDCGSTEPQNGLRGLSKDKIDAFVSNVQKAEQEDNFGGLVYEMCQILEQLCIENRVNQAKAEIKEWGDCLEIRQMLRSLNRFFQHSQQDIKLYMRLHLFSRNLRDIMTGRLRSDQVYIYLHDFCNILLSLIGFARCDPSKLVRFELVDSENVPLSCHNESVSYDEFENTYWQRFYIPKTSEDVLQLYAVARVHVNGQTCEKGAFQSKIVLNAANEEAFDKCMIGITDVAVMKLKDKHQGKLNVVLCSTKKEKIQELHTALEQELRERSHDIRKTDITQCYLKLSSIKPSRKLFLRLLYKWESEEVVFESKDFVTVAYCSSGSSCTPEKGLPETGRKAEASIENEWSPCPVPDKEHHEPPPGTHTSEQLGERIQILVRTMSREEFMLAVHSSDSVRSVKANIFKSRGHPPSTQRLIFCWKNLEDHRTLEEYGVNEESTQRSPVNLVLRLRDKQ